MKPFLSGLLLGLVLIAAYAFLVPPPPLPEPIDPYAGTAGESTGPDRAPDQPDPPVEDLHSTTFVLRSPEALPMGFVAHWVFRGPRLLAEGWTDGGGYFDCRGPPGPARLLVFPDGWVPQILDIDLTGQIEEIFLDEGDLAAVVLECEGRPWPKDVGLSASVPAFRRLWASLPDSVVDSLQRLAVSPDRVAFGHSGGGLHILRGLAARESVLVHPPVEFTWEWEGAEPSHIDLAPGPSPFLLRAKRRELAKGRVVAAAGGQPVPFGIVEAQGRIVSADAEGRFQLPLASLDALRVIVRDPLGSGRQEHALAAKPKAGDDLGDLPVAATRELQVQCVDSEGRAVRGALLLIEPEFGEESTFLPRTDATGGARLQVPTGAASFFVLARGHAAKEKEVQPDELSVLVRLEKEASLVVRVEGIERMLGAPRLVLTAPVLFEETARRLHLPTARCTAGGPLLLTTGPGGETAELALSPGGTAHVRNLARDANIVLRLVAGGRVLAEAEARTDPEHQAVVVLRVTDADAPCALRILDEDDDPASAARVRHAEAGNRPGEVWTDPDGTFLVPSKDATGPFEVLPRNRRAPVVVEAPGEGARTLSLPAAATAAMLVYSEDRRVETEPPAFLHEGRLVLALETGPGGFEVESSKAAPTAVVLRLGAVRREVRLSPARGGDGEPVQVDAGPIGGVRLHLRAAVADLVHVRVVSEAEGAVSFSRLLRGDREGPGLVLELFCVPDGSWRFEVTPLLALPGEEVTTWKSEVLPVRAGEWTEAWL